MEKRSDHTHTVVQAGGMKAFHLLVIVILVVQAFFLGSLWTKVDILKGGTTQAPAAAQAGAQPQVQAPTVDLALVKDSFTKSVIKFGDANSKLLLVEIADPSCPYCSIAAGHNGALNKQVGDRFTLVSDGGTYLAPVPEMKKLVDSGKAAFAYIYSPGHGNGEMGTKALYCAFEKGKFWEVHDKLMTAEGYDLLNNTVKNDKAKSGELSQFLGSAFDQNAMKECLDSGKYDEKLANDITLAKSLGVSGTPGFFVNETNFAGAYSWTDMESAAKAAL